MLGGVDRLLQSGTVAARRHRHLALGDHRSGVDTLVDEVDGDAGHLDAGLERLTYRVESREVRQ